jgi:hypothetical protein
MLSCFHVLWLGEKLDCSDSHITILLPRLEKACFSNQVTAVVVIGVAPIRICVLVAIPNQF